MKVDFCHHTHVLYVCHCFSFVFLWSWALPHRTSLSAEGFGGSGWPALIQRVYSIVLSAMVWLSASFIRKPNTSSSTWTHTNTLSWDETLLSLSRHSCQTYKHSPHTDTPTHIYIHTARQTKKLYVHLPGGHLGFAVTKALLEAAHPFLRLHPCVFSKSLWAHAFCMNASFGFLWAFIGARNQTHYYRRNKINIRLQCIEWRGAIRKYRLFIMQRVNSV